MKKIFIPTQNGSDWQKLLGKPKLHWKKGYSAMAAAACWEDSSPNIPQEIKVTLDNADDSSIANLELLLAIPEWKVALPGGETASQTDILAITRNTISLVVLGVEAKVDETFGPTLKEKKIKATEGQLSRISYLESELARKKPFSDTVRYQLLHRSVSTILTARSFHAPVAVMLVHSFSPSSAWRDDFDLFCSEMNCIKISSDVFEAPDINDVRLFLAWCKGDKKYLDSELPNVIENREAHT
ncbi:MAG: hypothetical protein JXL81_09725 [Deltaproteobacteria bacterium]|nr:hypothetical protein [Deltaproteobacteria bacterium]